MPTEGNPEIDLELVDTIAWAKTCMLIAAATLPGSAARDDELRKLKEAVVRPRKRIDAIFAAGGKVSTNLLVELRVCEKAIPALEKGAVLRRSEPKKP